MFYSCLNGVGSPTRCPEGLHYSETEGICVWARDSGRSGCGIVPEEEKRKKGVPDDLGVRRSLYIDQSRLASSRTLRSGRETSQKKEYVIKDARDPKFVQIVDEAGLEKLKKDERLISDTI